MPSCGTFRDWLADEVLATKLRLGDGGGDRSTSRTSGVAGIRRASAGPGHPARLRSGIAYHRPDEQPGGFRPSPDAVELLAMGLTAAVVLLVDQASKAAVASTLGTGGAGSRDRRTW